MSEAEQPSAYRLATFHDRSLEAEEIEHLISLHEELLPRSPVVRLGPRFMRQFFYRFLPSEGHITGAIAYLDDEPAGFITATHDPSLFMSRAFRRHWLRISSLGAVSILTAPRRLAAVKEALQVNRGLRDVSCHDRTGELLSLGVLPEFRAGQFIQETGIRIGDDMLADVIRSLRKKGVRRIRAVVDADNIAAGLFYLGRGWTTSSREATGWSESTVEFTMDLERRRDDRIAYATGRSTDKR